MAHEEKQKIKGGTGSTITKGCRCVPALAAARVGSGCEFSDQPVLSVAVDKLKLRMGSKWLQLFAGH